MTFLPREERAIMQADSTDSAARNPELNELAGILRRAAFLLDKHGKDITSDGSDSVDLLALECACRYFQAYISGVLGVRERHQAPACARTNRPPSHTAGNGSSIFARLSGLQSRVPIDQTAHSDRTKASAVSHSFPTQYPSDPANASQQSEAQS